VQLDQFVRSLATAWRYGEVRAPYKKRREDAKPHIWRTRPDPFEEVWPMLQQWLTEEPNTTAKCLFIRLNTEMPNRFKPGQYRTLQRRVKDWRTSIARRLVLGRNYKAEPQAVTCGIHIDGVLRIESFLDGDFAPEPPGFFAFLPSPAAALIEGR
jgi:hypothetical protein